MNIKWNRRYKHTGYLKLTCTILGKWVDFPESPSA